MEKAPKRLGGEKNKKLERKKRVREKGRGKNEKTTKESRKR